MGKENQMKLSTAVLIGVVAGWSESDYPDHQFKCVDDDGQVFCKWIKCKLFPKLKVLNKYVPGLPTDVIQCPSLAESGCPTQWGMVYKSNSKLYDQDTHDLVPPNGIKHSSKTGKVTATCLNAMAARSKFVSQKWTWDSRGRAFCRPEYNKNATPAYIEFTWQKSCKSLQGGIYGCNIPSCPGPGESWAPWGSWSGINTPTCERGTASRSRQCLDGDHPGTPTPCSTQPAGPAKEEDTYWPKVCNKCHADMGMMFTSPSTSDTGIPNGVGVPNLWTPGQYNNSKEDRFDDGFVPVGQGVLKLKCHDWASDATMKPTKQTCKCTDDGCRLGDAPTCHGVNYKGYGTDYFWQPGAKDTYKNEHCPTCQSTVTVSDDFTITYGDPSQEADQRFPDRVAWWPGGPSICRSWGSELITGVYVPGMEKPYKLEYNIESYGATLLECGPATYHTNKGMRYYEVLTADDNAIDWKLASAFTDDEIEDRMVILGNNQKLERKFYGLCRLSSCTQGNVECSTSMSQSLAPMKNGYPGTLSWKSVSGKYQWFCWPFGILSYAAKDTATFGMKVDESTDLTKFEILVKN